MYLEAKPSEWRRARATAPEGLEFGALGLGFEVWGEGLGVGVHDLGCRVWGRAFRV